jgi:two-component system response regulator MprA
VTAARSILVVDDDARLAQVIAMFFENAGYEVVTAGGGAAALEALGAQRPDVVVLDVMMPGLSGIEVCRRIRSTADLADLPVLVLTADASNRALARDAGADGFLAKPFSLDGLRAEVEALLRVSPKT